MTTSNAADESVIAKPVRILVDAHVVASFERNWEVRYARRNGTVEDVAKEMERAVSDFEDFLRDHRSQDIVELAVERDYEVQCSNCKDRYEPWKPTEKECEESSGDLVFGKTYCACCEVETE